MTYIIKASGRKERFNPKKISKSVMRAGASRDFARQISQNISKRIKPGDRTGKILNLTLKSLHKHPEIAAKYDLKRAIMHLGPTGFPFEKYFARVLGEYGYRTEVGNVLKGKNITHEIDVNAQNIQNKKRYMVECKYHNHVGNYTGIKTALYVYARFLDLRGFDYPWVVTNTHCSRDVLNYARGIKMRVTSWGYPQGESLRELITKKGLYPITIIREINQRTKMALFAAKIMMLKDLVDYDIKKLRQKTGLSERFLRKIMHGARKICEVNNKNEN
tara:strand:- start:324 stop:1148 length:825 start_codon:yes stop_codon:yes gene_type:complete